MAGMNAAMQQFSENQAAFNSELALCTNYPVGDIQEQLRGIQHMQRQLLDAVHRVEYSIYSRDSNTIARIHNSRVFGAHDRLWPMVSINTRPNAAILLDTPIPGFPATPSSISNLTANQCITILEALWWFIPPGLDEGGLRTSVKAAIGLVTY